MSDKPAQTPKSLSDDQIVTREVPRRKFLMRVALGSAALAGAGLISACSSADDCDNDVTRFRDNDPFDTAQILADPCDNDS